MNFETIEEVKAYDPQLVHANNLLIKLNQKRNHKLTTRQERAIEDIISKLHILCPWHRIRHLQREIELYIHDIAEYKEREIISRKIIEQQRKKIYDLELTIKMKKFP